MKYIETSIPDVWVLEPRVFEDARGYFMETWREEDFNQHIGRKVHFVQDNQSLSSRGVLRGLHTRRANSRKQNSSECYRELLSTLQWTCEKTPLLSGNIS